MPGPGGAIRREAKRFRGRLIWALVLGTLLRLGTGCGVQDSRLGRVSDFAGGMRWAAGDTSRVLGNAQYFKLMGQPELGIKELEDVHRLNPGNLQVADALAQYYEELGLGAQAQQIYLEALALAPDTPALQNNLCFSYYQAGNWSEAETCFRQTLSRQPNNQFVRNNLGLVLCRQGRQEEARRLWHEAHGEVAAAQKLGEALAALGMAGEARYAQQTRLQHPAKSDSRHSPSGGQGGADPVTATAGPLPSRASLPAVKHENETATHPASPAPGLAGAKPAAPPPPPQMGRDSRGREIPGPKRVEDRVNSAVSSSQPPAFGPAAGIQPPRQLLSRSETAAAPPLRSSPGETATPARPGITPPPPVLASQPDPKRAEAKTPWNQPRANPWPPLNARELMETNITIFNGNGIHNLARETRSRLHLEGYNVVAINNFRDFGADRTVIYFRPEVERVARVLNKKFFPGAELEPAPRLADSIDVQVVLGRDLSPQQQATTPRGMNCGSKERAGLGLPPGQS
jgi:Tfp pilus assembly protein PilF